MKKISYVQQFKLLTGCTLFAAGLILAFSAKMKPEFAEWYVVTIYPALSRFFQGLVSIVPFSVSELLLYILILAAVCSTVALIVKAVRKDRWKYELLRMVSSLFLTAGMLFFLFVLNCGINYYRIPFSEYEHIQTLTYTKEQLKEVSVYLANQVNQESAEVARQSSGEVKLPGNPGRMAVLSMKNVSAEYESLAGNYPKPKRLLNPEILSYQNITGIYSPFTVEANYNNDVTNYNIPFVMCHELSHLKGFMQEQEANFIAYLACINSDDVAFRYSGNLLAYIYCTNVLRKESPKDYEEVRNILNPEVMQDLHRNNQFWAKYDGRIAQVSNQINDTYLKANGQNEGVKSYDKMVDLVVADYFQSLDKL